MRLLIGHLARADSPGVYLRVRYWYAAWKRMFRFDASANDPAITTSHPILEIELDDHKELAADEAMTRMDPSFR